MQASIIHKQISFLNFFRMPPVLYQSNIHLHLERTIVMLYLLYLTRRRLRFNIPLNFINIENNSLIVIVSRVIPPSDCRNPNFPRNPTNVNSAYKRGQGGGADRQRGSATTFDWDPYDPTYRKYLHIGEFKIFG